MTITDYERSGGRKMIWFQRNAGNALWEEGIWEHGYPSIMCMNDAPSLLMFFHFFFSFVLGKLAGILSLRRGEALLLQGGWPTIGILLTSFPKWNIIIIQYK